MQRFSTAALVISLCIGCPLGATKVAPIHIPLESFVLDNGMRFILLERPDAVVTSAGWVVASGSAADPVDKQGLAHLLEHMMFKGTPRVDDFSTLYAEAGATGLDARTYEDFSLYFVTLPATKVELWFWLESDRLLEPVFRHLNQERKVVVEERRQRVESHPLGRFQEELFATFWAETPYAWLPLGRPDHLERVKDRDLKQHFAEIYAPHQLAAVLVGPHDLATVERLAKRYFERLASTSAKPTAAPLPRARHGDKRLQVRASRPQLQLLYPTVPHHHGDAAALTVTAALLNGLSGRLYRHLVLDRGSASAAYALHHALRRGGYFALTAEAPPGQDADSPLADLEAEVASLVAKPPPARELLKAQNQLRADLYRRLKDPAVLVQQLLIDAGLGDWRALNTGPARIAAVTADDVQRVARTYLDPDHRLIGICRVETTAREKR